MLEFAGGVSGNIGCQMARASARLGSKIAMHTIQIGSVVITSVLDELYFAASAYLPLEAVYPWD